MDRDERLVGRVVAVEHDFPDQDMGNPLLGSSVRARRIPCRRQIAGERHQRRAIDLRAKRRGNVLPGDAIHALNRVPIGSVEDLRRALDGRSRGEPARTRTDDADSRIHVRDFPKARAIRRS